MLPRKSPCYRCEERTEGCHGKCDKYAQYRADCKAEYSARIAHSEVVAYTAKKDERVKKQWERKAQMK